MRKFSLTFLCALILFVLISPRAQALDIIILQDGSVQFFNGQVLGDSDQEEPETEHVETPSTEVKEVKKEEPKKPEEKRQETPVRTISKSEKTQVRLRENQKQTEVVLEKRRTNEGEKNTKGSSEKFEAKQVLRTDSVRMELPASQKPSTNEMEREDNSPEQETETPERRGAQVERTERQDEKVQIESKINDDGTTEFQFQSRGVNATVKNAEIVVNPETNAVSIVTPSGESVELVHLPDQARERMQEAGLIESNDNADIEVEANDAGETVFRVKQEKSKRFLGIIPRKVETQVEFNDQTGEVQESTVRSNNAFVRLLNQLSL